MIKRFKILSQKIPSIKQCPPQFNNSFKDLSPASSFSFFTFKNRDITSEVNRINNQKYSSQQQNLSPREFLEHLTGLKNVLGKKENSEKVSGIFWNICENIKSNPQQEIDSSLINLILLLSNEKVITYRDFDQIEQLFLDPKRLTNLKIKDLQKFLKGIVSHGHGSEAFYESLSQVLIEKIQLPKDKHFFYQSLEDFTLANAMSQEFCTKSIKYIEDLLVNREKPLDFLPANDLGSLAFFMALKYDETKHLHRKFYEVLSRILQNKKNDFYESLQKHDSLKYFWMFFTSTKAHNPELFKEFEDKGVTKAMPFVFKGVFPSKQQKEIYAAVKNLVGDSRKVTMEKRIGAYFVDIFVEPNIVIEVNSYKYYFGYKSRRSGPAEIRFRNLTAMGYSFKEIPLKLWHNTPNEEKNAILDQLLNRPNQQ